MKNKFNTASKNINQYKLVSKQLEHMLDSFSMDPTGREIELVWQGIINLKNKLIQDVKNLDASSKNKVWGLHGPEDMGAHIKSTTANIESLKLKSSAADMMVRDDIYSVLERLGEIENEVIALQKVQKQSPFVNFFKSRFPVFVR